MPYVGASATGTVLGRRRPTVLVPGKGSAPFGDPRLTRINGGPIRIIGVSAAIADGRPGALSSGHRRPVRMTGRGR
jgi:hypothetical protein